MRESEYQQELKKTIQRRLPKAIILKNDPNWLQGFPDLTVMLNGRYALLEAKVSENAAKQPNQEYYIESARESGVFASFIFPENEKEVLDGLQRALEA